MFFLALVLCLLEGFLALRYQTAYKREMQELTKGQLEQACAYRGYLAPAYGLLYALGQDRTSRLEVNPYWEERFGQAKGRLLVHYHLALDLMIGLRGLQLLVLSQILYPSLGLPICFLTVGLVLMHHSHQKKQKEERRQALLLDLPVVIGKLILLLNAGQTLKQAWRHIAQEGVGPLYEEMRQSLLEEQNGRGEREALLDFSKRCGQAQVRKFSALILQSYSKGSQELVASLDAMLEAAWTEKKNLVLQEAKAASQRLLLPSAIIFLGIMLIILGPLLSGGFY